MEIKAHGLHPDITKLALKLVEWAPSKRSERPIHGKVQKETGLSRLELPNLRCHLLEDLPILTTSKEQNLLSNVQKFFNILLARSSLTSETSRVKK